MTGNFPVGTSQVLRGFEVCSPRPESATAVYGFLQEQGAIILGGGFKYLSSSPLFGEMIQFD